MAAAEGYLKVWLEGVKRACHTLREANPDETNPNDLNECLVAIQTLRAHAAALETYLNERLREVPS